MSNKLLPIAALVATGLVNTSVYAVQFDGFLTAGVTTLDDKGQNLTSYQGITSDARFDVDSRFGLQISSEVDKNMSVVGQLLATGSNENYNALVEWAYVDYAFSKQISLRAGKIKEPVFLISDYVEVGYAYPWIRPPAEVYSNNPLNTVNGMEVLFQFPIGRKNSLSFQPYIGTNSEEIPGTGGAGQFEATNIMGVDIKFSGRGYSFHVSSLKTDVSTQGALVAPADLSGGTAPGFVSNVAFDLNATGEAELTSVGVTADIDNFVLYAEWQDRDETGGIEALFTDQESSYITLGYRINKWMPHVTIASIEGQFAASNAVVTCATVLGCATPAGTVPNGQTAFPTGGQFPYAEQSSVTAGVRYELNSSAALKVEHQIVDVETKNNVAGAYQNFGLFTPSFSSAATSEKVGITSIALDVIF